VRKTAALQQCSRGNVASVLTEGGINGFDGAKQHKASHHRLWIPLGGWRYVVPFPSAMDGQAFFKPAMRHRLHPLRQASCWQCAPADQARSTPVAQVGRVRIPVIVDTTGGVLE
jgi:hypothetical protein